MRGQRQEVACFEVRLIKITVDDSITIAHYDRMLVVQGIFFWERRIRSSIDQARSRRIQDLRMDGM
jgi:hypothetical protein